MSKYSKIISRIYIIGEQAYLIRVDEEKNEQNQLSQQNNQQDNEELQEENTQKLS